MREWQPIATAPAGVPVLVFVEHRPGAGSHFIAFKDVNGEWATLPSRWEAGSAPGAPTTYQKCQPQYWMLLPAPP